MSTLIFTYGYPPADGGIESYSASVSNGLIKHGETIVVLAPYFKDCRSLDSQQPYAIIRSPSKLFLRELWMIVILPWLIKKYNVTRIFSTVWLPCGLITWLVTRFIKIPYFLSAHGSEILETQNLKSPFKHQIRKRLRLFKLLTFNNAKGIFAISNYTRQLVVSHGIPSEKVYFIPNGVDTSQFFPIKDVSKIRTYHKLTDCKIILTISRLDDYKGHDTVIRVLPQVLSIIPESIYLVVGKGPEMERLKKLTKDIGVLDRVVFTGYLPDDKMVQYYNVCDIFIMVSRVDDKDFEGFGLVYLEANACGKPVIGGNSGGVADAIVHRETGLLVDPTNENAVANAIIRLLNDPDEARRMGENGLRRVQDELDWVHVTRRMRSIMDREEVK